LPTASKIEPATVVSSGAPLATEATSPEGALFWRVSWTAAVLGCLLRIVQYRLDRSLWMDEAYVSLNILHRSFAGLCRALDYHQGAPIGFLLLEKSAVRLWGGGEYVLRLFPLLAGIASVLLFYRLASKALPARAVPVAVGLFAISPSLIYYSSEVKQYSSDVAIALLL
jgi:predicted membrane-bound mannosyltransferase